MPDSRAKELLRQSDELFSQRQGLVSVWQAIAENFYVERADFTGGDRSDGEEFAEHLFSSFPALARRELADLFMSHLRPSELQWFGLHVADDALDKDTEARAYLEFRTGVMWRAMYDPATQFVKQTKRADHDFATFGGAVIEASLNSRRDALLYRTRHLRDCVWMENADGEVDTLYFRWRPTAKQLMELYPTKVSPQVRKQAEKTPSLRVNCCIASVPERLYRIEGARRTRPWTYIVFEKDTETILQETPERWFRYVVPRWAVIDGSPYPRSPTAEICLPDGRTFQVMIRSIREAGEMHVNPPTYGVGEAFRSDFEMWPGGFTAVDSEFVNTDSNRGLDDALRTINTNPGAMPIGFEIASALKEDIRTSWFLNRIKLPDVSTKEMTAFEFQKRMEEHVREAAPVFRPIEDEYNAPLLNLTHDILDSVGAFGPPDDIPDVLSGQQVEFKFRSPLRDVREAAKAGMFTDWMERIVLPTINMDPAMAAKWNVEEAAEDASLGLRVPASWIGPKEAVQQAREQQARAQEMQAGLAALQQGGDAAQAVGAGAEAVAPLVDAAG